MIKRVLLVLAMAAIVCMPAVASADWSFSATGYYDNYPGGAISGVIDKIDAYITSGAIIFTTSGPGMIAYDGTWTTGGWSATNINSKYVQATTLPAVAAVNWDYRFDGAGPVYPFTLDWNAFNGTTFVGHEHIALDASGSISGYYDTIKYNAVPIPAAAWLLGSGLIGLVGLRRRFKK